MSLCLNGQVMSFEKLENEVFAECKDCNESELKDFLNTKMLYVDSTINSIYLEIESCILKKTNCSVKKKISELSEFSSTFNLWKNLRRTSCITHSSFYKGGGYYSIQYGIMYLYMSNSLIGFMNGYLEHRSQG